MVGPLITGVKKLNLRLLAYVFDDLARQADAAVGRLETALAAEVAAREALSEALDAEAESPPCRSRHEAARALRANRRARGEGKGRRRVVIAVSSALGEDVAVSVHEARLRLRLM